MEGGSCGAAVVVLSAAEGERWEDWSSEAIMSGVGEEGGGAATTSASSTKHMAMVLIVGVCSKGEARRGCRDGDGDNDNDNDNGGLWRKIYGGAEVRYLGT